MKAQSAIEYLITYGWMLIAVSIVVGAVYSVYDPICSESASQFTRQPVQIHDFGVDYENNLDIVLENREFDRLNVSRIVLEDGDDKRIIYDPTTIEPGSREVMTAQEADQDTARCASYDVEIHYDRGTLEDQRSSGSLTTSIDFPDLNPPSPPENAELSLE